MPSLGDAKKETRRAGWLRKICYTATPASSSGPVYRVYFVHQVLPRRRLKQFAINFPRLEGERAKKGSESRNGPGIPERIPTVFAFLPPLWSLQLSLLLTTSYTRYLYTPPYSSTMHWYPYLNATLYAARTTIHEPFKIILKENIFRVSGS